MKNKKNKAGFTVIEILLLIKLCVILFLAIGWVMNVVKLIKLDFQSPYKAEIIRAIGVPAAPFGGIIGWFTIEDGPVSD